MSTKTARILSNLFNLVVILAMFFGPLAQIRVQAFTDTNQEDYAPGSVVTIYGDNRNFEVGKGYQPGETVVVTVTQPVSPDPLTCEAVVKEDGSWSCDLQLSSDPAYAVGLYTYVTFGLTSSTTEKHSFTDANPAANLDQCGNGKAGNEPCLNDSTYANWVNGNLGESKSRYVEGDSIPYRLVFTNLTLGMHTVTFEWDTNKAGTHAIDYLTTWDRSVSGDPTSGVSGTFSGPSTFPIPIDLQVTDAGVTPIPGNFTIWNGTNTSVSAYSYPNGTGFSGDKSARISITFTATSNTAVLAWGGHISTRLDWGNAVSAVDIQGSPYHTRLIALDGSGGNQDRSLSTSAVIFPGSITVIKQATPEGSTSFPFTASPAPLDNFPLVDNGTSSNTNVFSNITNFTTYSVTEQTPAGWTFGGIVCSVTSANGGSQTISGATATIKLNEGENVTCTYTNTRNYDQDLTVIKTATASYGRLYKWLIDKSVEDTQIDIAEGGTATFNYSVKVAPDGYTDSTWAVSGKITVANPNGFDVTGVEVTDTIDNGGDCTVTNGTNVTVPKNGSVELSYGCTYESAPTAANGTNTATAAWTAAALYSPHASASGTEGVDFSAVTPSETYKTITVVDDKTDPLSPVTLGTWNWADGVHTFTYSLVKAGVAGSCTDYTNTAVIDETDQSDTQKVTVCVGKDLTVRKTATASLSRTYNWLIDKSVDKTEIDIAQGGTATFTYTVKVTPDGYTDSTFALGGTITITNPNDWENVTLTSVEDTLDQGGTCTITEAAPYIVPKSESLILHYTCTTDGTTTKNTATVTWDKAAYFTPTGTASADAEVSFAISGETNKTITVIDDKTDPENPVTLGTWKWADGEHTFTYSLDKQGVAGKCTDYTNTAVIDETDQSDAQKVSVCVGKDLTVSKTAAGTFDRTYLWSISKAADKTEIDIASGGTATFNYTVAVAQTGFSDSGWTLGGKITLSNPNDWEAITLTSLGDAVDNGGVCTVDPGPYKVLAGKTLDVNYSCTYASAPSSYSGTNTVTATWDKAAAFTPTGSASGSAEFTLSQLGATNKTIHVTDSYDGDLGTVTATDSAPFATGTFTYDRTESGLAGKCTTYDNTATITETKQTADKSVTLCVAKDLTVTKTAVPTFTRTWDWTIEKTADATYDLFAGGSVTHGYKVTVTPDPVDSAWKVVGVITIANPNDWEAIDANVADATSLDGTCVVASETVSVPASGSVDVGYTCTWATTPTSYTGSNTATVTWDKTAYFTPGDTATGTKDFEFSNPNEINPVITVTDDKNGALGSANRAGAGWSYSKEFACSTNPADYTDGTYSDSLTNTATINETGQTDTATVTVNCYAPVVSKTAVGTYDERHEWDVTKTVNPVSQSAFAGDTVSYEWKIVVTEETVEENFKVGGAISVVNPALMEMTVDLSDSLGSGTGGVIGSCTNGTYADGKLTIPANKTATCAYTAKPGNDDDKVNNVTATLNGIVFANSATFGWTANVIRGEVSLGDNQNPDLPKTISDGGTWTYTEQYTCSTDKTAYDATTHKYTFGESNTATISSGDFNDSFSASTSVDCYVPVISKDAAGKYDEVHDWEVFKSVNTASQTAFAGEEKNFTWTVRVDETTHGENYSVTGGITVVNPNPEDALVVALSDSLDDGSIATIGPCTGGTWSSPNLTVPAGGTAVCDYSVTPKGDLNTFADALPAQVTMKVSYPVAGGPAYFPVTTVSGDGPLNGTYEGWCADIDHTIAENTNYTANVYSSYETLPAGIIEQAYNLDLVNWIINQDFVGKPAGGTLGNYTYGDVQRAIWELIEDNGTSNTSGLGSWNQTRMNQIKVAAIANGEGFIPTCGDFVAVILQPVGGQQLVTIAQVTFASLGVNCATSNAVTAVINDIEFPASATILWTANPINATASLDDDQKLGWPTPVSADTTFTYQDPQGYTCSTDPQSYTNGFYQYNESNTAVLTYNTGSDTAIASTAVRCYAPVVSKTAAGTYDERHEWDVEKSVDPTVQNAFAGDTVSYDWTVKVTESVIEEKFLASGTISVKNPRPDDGNMTVKLTDVLGDGFVPTITGCTGGTWNATNKSVAVPANTTAVCSYTASLDYSDHTKAPTSNTATAELIAGTTHLVTTASAVLGWTANVIRGSATLDDDQNPAFPLDITDGGTWEYSEKYTCSTDKAQYDATSLWYKFGEDNTATVSSGDKSDSASASTDVNCYWPQIELTKTGDALSKIGDGVTYSIKLENNTPTDAGLRDLSCTVSDTTIGFSKTVTLASGASDISTKTFTIPVGAADPFLNTASVTCSPLDSTFSVSDLSTWSTNLFQPAVEILKTGPTNAAPGAKITYTFTINNLSSSDSPNLMLDTIKDDVLGDLADDAPAACDELAPGSSCTFIVDDTLSASEVAFTKTNVVTVHYHPADFPNDITDTDDHTVTVTPESQLTDTLFCPLPNDQFRLLYRLQVAPNVYLLNGSNPGQFYYNAFYYGKPGSTFSMDIEIPYPFMTQEGAGNPIQVHDGTGLTSSGCYAPNPSLSGFTINTEAMAPTSPAGNQIITPEDYGTKQLGQTTTVTVSGVVPASGMAYVTIHLDYSLKKTGSWKPAGTFTTNPVSGASIGDMNNAAGFGSGPVTIHGYEVYHFSRTVGGVTATSTSSSYNEIKKFAGFLGFVNSLSTEAPVANVQVQILNPKGVLLATLYTDADGYYMYAYKHTAKSATYTVKLPGYAKSVSVLVKANGFAAVDFDLP